MYDRRNANIIIGWRVVRGNTMNKVLKNLNSETICWRQRPITWRTRTRGHIKYNRIGCLSTPLPPHA